MAELREEELNVLVGKLSELVAKNIVDAHMVGITTEWTECGRLA